MAWVFMSLRKQELKTQINDDQFEILALNRKLRQYNKYSSAIADGTLSPSEVAAMGSGLFADAIDFMGFSSDTAAQTAQEKTDYYSSMMQQVIDNGGNGSSIALQYGIYLDENGNLNEEETYQKFYEEALKEYAEEYIAPALKEIETDIETQKTELETQLTAEQAELESIEQSISTEIQKSAPKLS